jgi:glycosyltransferase involved in cell wall biosynthesis
MPSVMLVASSQVSIPPEKGGAIEDIVYAIAESLSKSQTKVYVVSPSGSSHAGINYVTIKSTKRKAKLAAILQDIIFGFKAFGKIRKIKPDVVHLNTTFTSLPMALLSRWLPENTKLIYTSHSPAWTVPDNEIGLANRFFNTLEAFVMRKAHAVTTVSDSMRKGIVAKASIDASKVATIPNFSRPDEFSPKYGKGWKKSRGIKGPMLLFIGKLTETKGIRYLLEAMPDVVKKIHNATLVLVGSLEHEQDLDKNPWLRMAKDLGISDSVRFLGLVDRKDLPKVYSAADVFVFPSLREAFGMVIAEALASGVPIIASDIEVFREIVNTKCAILTRRKSHNLLSKAIIRVIENHQLASSMSKEARKAALRIEKDAIMEKYRLLYAKVAGF